MRLQDPKKNRDSDAPAKLSRWGRLFLSSLEKNDPTQFQELTESGELQTVAASVDELASAEYEQTLNGLLEKETATKKFANRQAQIARVKRQAEEIVRESVVVPNPEWAKQKEEGYTDENTSTWSEEPLLPKVPDTL